MTQDQIKQIKNEYPQGTVLELTEDMQSDGKPEKDMVKGLQGKINYIDDAGQLHIKWNNGRSLALIPEVDHFKEVE